MVIAAQVWETRPTELENSLRWGGDATGGAPYIYDKNGRQVGFESDLAKCLAKQLDMQSSFVQGAWDQLPRLLDRKNIDIVLNGYEWSTKRDELWASTIPYYSYSLDLIVHSDNDSIKTWEDLGSPPEGT